MKVRGSLSACHARRREDFDPAVVKAFERAFAKGEMEIPETLHPLLGDELLAFSSGADKSAGA
jgi:hypothetical protein